MLTTLHRPVPGIRIFLLALSCHETLRHEMTSHGLAAELARQVIPGTIVRVDYAGLVRSGGGCRGEGRVIFGQCLLQCQQRPREPLVFSTSGCFVAKSAGRRS